MKIGLFGGLLLSRADAADAGDAKGCEGWPTLSRDGKILSCSPDPQDSDIPTVKCKEGYENPGNMRIVKSTGAHPWSVKVQKTKDDPAKSLTVASFQKKTDLPQDIIFCVKETQTPYVRYVLLAIIFVGGVSFFAKQTTIHRNKIEPANERQTILSKVRDFAQNASAVNRSYWVCAEIYKFGLFWISPFANVTIPGRLQVFFLCFVVGSLIVWPSIRIGMEALGWYYPPVDANTKYATKNEKGNWVVSIDDKFASRQNILGCNSKISDRYLYPEPTAMLSAILNDTDDWVLSSLESNETKMVLGLVVFFMTEMTGELWKKYSSGPSEKTPVPGSTFAFLFGKIFQVFRIVFAWTSSYKNLAQFLQFFFLQEMFLIGSQLIVSVFGFSNFDRRKAEDLENLTKGIMMFDFAKSFFQVVGLVGYTHLKWGEHNWFVDRFETYTAEGQIYIFFLTHVFCDVLQTLLSAGTMRIIARLNTRKQTEKQMRSSSIVAPTEYEIKQANIAFWKKKTSTTPPFFLMASVGMDAMSLYNVYAPQNSSHSFYYPYRVKQFVKCFSKEERWNESSARSCWKQSDNDLGKSDVISQNIKEALEKVYEDYGLGAEEPQQPKALEAIAAAEEAGAALKNAVEQGTSVKEAIKNDVEQSPEKVIQALAGAIQALDHAIQAAEVPADELKNAQDLLQELKQAQINADADNRAVTIEFKEPEPESTESEPEQHRTEPAVIALPAAPTTLKTSNDELTEKPINQMQIIQIVSAVALCGLCFVVVFFAAFPGGAIPEQSFASIPSSQRSSARSQGVTLLSQRPKGSKKSGRASQLQSGSQPSSHTHLRSGSNRLASAAN